MGEETRLEAQVPPRTGQVTTIGNMTELQASPKSPNPDPEGGFPLPARAR